MVHMRCTARQIRNHRAAASRLRPPPPHLLPIAGSPLAGGRARTRGLYRGMSHGKRRFISRASWITGSDQVGVVQDENQNENDQPKRKPRTKTVLVLVLVCRS